MCFSYDNYNRIHCIADPATGGNLLKSYMWESSIDNLLAVIRDDGVFASTYDANGNVSEYVSLADGSIAAHYEYDPFGNIVAQAGPLADGFTFRFSTKPYCPLTGIVHYEMRPYSPPLGHFLPRDPLDEEGGVNLYGFCGGDPVNKWDFLGMFTPSRDQQIKEHFKELKEQLKNQLKDMCPEEPTRWEKTKRYGEGVLCCTPDDCKATAEAMAEAYITALEDAYRARTIPGGWIGNFCNVLTFRSDSGKTYPDGKTHLSCQGWENMANATLAEKFNLYSGAGDSCWSYKHDYDTKGDGGHIWGTLRVMDGSPKVLDPWKSGGYTY